MEDMTRVLAMSVDLTIRKYGYPGAAGHSLMIPEGFQGDPLAAGTKIRRVCGGTVDVKRMEEKYSGADKLCATCIKRTTDAMIDAGIQAQAAAQSGEMISDNTPDAARLTLDAAITAADSMRYDTVRPGIEIKWPMPKNGKAAQMPVKVQKCAVKGVDKVAPKPGTDADGVNGTCPVCQTVAKLTGKGFIGAHVVNGESAPASPEMGQKTVKAVDTGAPQGDPSDAAKRREREAYTVTGKGEHKTITPNVPTTTAGQSPVGMRDHGMMDGPAMLPRGTYANGSRPDPKVVKEEIAGGKFGTLTKAEVGKLSRSQQRSYWRKVAKRRNG